MPPSKGESVLGLFEQAREGNERAIARLCTIIERGEASDLLPSLDVIGRDWTADVIAITGAPGVGKSTLVARLISLYRKEAARVAVLAVDPSSSLTGGALLGDRVRLNPSEIDEHVFFRSVADHGHRGGVSATTGAAIALFDACGFDLVIVETVGTGQADVDIRGFVETVVVVCAPGGGDEVQALKAGILEIGDIFVVNKSDLDGAVRVHRDLREMIALGSYASEEWHPPVISVTSTFGSSVVELKDACDLRRTWLFANVPKLERARRRARAQVVDAAVNFVRTASAVGAGAHSADRLGECIINGEDKLEDAARRLISSLLDESSRVEGEFS